MVHSSWSFVIESLSLAVPFLCVAVTREPQLYFSKRQIDFGEVPVGASRRSTRPSCSTCGRTKTPLVPSSDCAGCRVQRPVDLVNCEEETFPFAVTQPSLLCEDQKSSLKLDPLSGVALPKARSDKPPKDASVAETVPGMTSDLLVLQAVAGGELHPLLPRPEEIQGGFEDEEEAGAPGPHGQGQLSPHVRLAASGDAGRRPPAGRP